MKLITWNTQWCCGLDGSVSPQRIVDQARAMADFDVLCLQEIAQGFDGLDGGPGDQPAQLQALLPGFRLFFGAAVDEFDSQGRRQRFGNLIATRLPVARVHHQALPWPADPAVSSMPRMCSSLTLISSSLGLPLRVMTTHLEYHSGTQRLAQARALRGWHAEAVDQALAPPQAEAAGTPFQAKLHAPEALLCGDFNMPASDAAYAELLAPFGSVDGAQRRLHDAWQVAHGATPQPPTFRLYDQRFGTDPVACDFVFLSDGLAPRLRRIEVDTATRASDHQPVLVELA